MRIAFNPSTVAALTTPPNNKDITFDLRGRNIFARGVKFYGTDTNTWRDIKINNVSIGSHTLDLRNGSNTTLTNTNGVVTINSTWRPVVDNLTSNSTTSSLSANQGRVLAGLINDKSDSGHNHDDRYLKLTGGTMTGNIILSPNVEIIKPLRPTSNYDSIVRWSVNGETEQYGREIGLHNDGGHDSTGSIAIVPYKTSITPWSGTVGLFIAKNALLLDGKPIALKSDIPSSLKNPYALTISLNGTSQGPYDGSAAKNINITPGSIGAATSGHNHDDRYLRLAGGTMQLGEGLKFHADNNYFGTNSDARIISLLDNNDKVCDGGLIIDERATLDGKEYVTELLRIRDSEFKWKGSNILHSGNYSSILDSRYYTESEVNSLLSKKLNTSDFNWTSLPGKIVAGNEFNIVNAGFKSGIWFNYLPINDRNKTAMISNYSFGNGAQGYASVTASGFIKKGSSSSYVLLGDGGHKTESSLNVANADTVDGYHATSGNNTPWGTIPAITTNGWMDIGRQLEFHYDNTTGSDYSTVLRCTGNYSNIIDMPSKSGTLALTSQVLTWKSQIIDMRNYSGSYWHPVTVWLPYTGYNKIKVSVQLNSGDKPSWAEHPSGITCNMEIWATASGWGTTDSETICLNYTYKQCSQNPCGWMQLGNPSLGVLFLRGGSRYRVYTDFDATFTPHDQKYTWTSGSYSQNTGGPYTSCPGLNFNKNKIYANLDGYASSAIKLQTTHSLWGQSFDGTSDVSGSLSGTGTITPSFAGAFDIGTDSLDYRYGYFQWVGAKTNTNLRLAANNSDNQIVLHTNGNVGVGTNSPGYKLQINGDQYTTGWSRADNGFYCEGAGVHFTHNGSVGEIAMTSNNEFTWGTTTSELYFNFRKASRGKTVTKYIWNAGSSTSWANHSLGALDLHGDVYWTNGDATMKIYGVDTCCGKENVAFQSTFDGENPLTSTYVTKYRTRSAILLQPRGGNVGINVSHDPSYTLTVGGNIYSSGGFIKSGSNDNYVLLGGGSHKLESALNVAHANISSSANKLTTVRNIALGTDLRGSANFDGGSNIIINANINACTIGVGSTNGLPFKRIAHFETGSSSNDNALLLYISQGYINGSNGICRVEFRTDNISSSNSNPSASSSVRWLVRNGYNLDSLYAGYYVTTGKAYIDIYLKTTGSYQGTVIRVLQDSRGGINSNVQLINSYYYSDTNHKEAYNSVEAASTALYNRAYTRIVSGSDVGTVSHANSASNADTTDGVHIKWAGTLTSTSHLVAWEKDGSALRDINPANVSVGYASSAGNANTLGGTSLGGLFTAFGNNAHNITATIGGVTKSFLVNWAADSDKLDGKHASDFATAGHNHDGRYLRLDGSDTMTGVLNVKANQYNDSYNGAINMNNSNIYGLNSIYTSDRSDSPAEGIHFWRDTTHVDTLRMMDGKLLFTPNRLLGSSGTELTVLHTGNSSVSGHTITINGTSTTWSWRPIGTGASDAAAGNHTHKVKINGSEKIITATNAKDVVDLGTYLTSHQSLAGYVNTVETIGAGNAVTSIVKAGGKITANKGTTFLTSHQSLANYYTKGQVDTKLGKYLPLAGGTMNAGAQIQRTAKDGMWYQGRSIALLRETSANGYHALWSLKTTDGSWDFGEYNSSGWNNIPVLSYVLDSNFDKGSNITTYQIKFPLASGTIALTSNILNPTNYYWANNKITSTSKIDAEVRVKNLGAGCSTTIENTIMATNWVRAMGNTGIYFQDHGGGLYMSDNTWIRTWAGKALQVDNTIRSTDFHTTYYANNVWTITSAARLENSTTLVYGTNTSSQSINTYLRGTNVILQVKNGANINYNAFQVTADETRCFNYYNMKNGAEVSAGKFLVKATDLSSYNSSYINHSLVINNSDIDITTVNSIQYINKSISFQFGKGHYWSQVGTATISIPPGYSAKLISWSDTTSSNKKIYDVELTGNTLTANLLNSTIMGPDDIQIYYCLIPDNSIKNLYNTNIPQLYLANKTALIQYKDKFLALTNSGLYINGPIYQQLNGYHQQPIFIASAIYNKSSWTAIGCSVSGGGLIITCSTPIMNCTKEDFIIQSSTVIVSEVKVTDSKCVCVLSSRNDSYYGVQIYYMPS